MSLVNFYKIVCNDSGAIYVGSTITSIKRRLQKHESNYRCYLENKQRFTTSFTIIEKNNYTIQLIDSVECVDKKQRDMLEAIYILNENSINKVQPGRDRKQYLQDNKEKIKQYRQDNKEKIKEKQQQYQQDNKEKIKERHNQYYNNNKEKIKEQCRQYREDNKEKNIQYRQDNKEKLNEYQQQYQQDNKEKIKEKRRQYWQDNKEKIKEKQINFTCQCGSQCTYFNKSRHMKSKKHLNYLATL